jgi:hypothetical protein
MTKCAVKAQNNPTYRFIDRVKHVKKDEKWL